MIRSVKNKLKSRNLTEIAINWAWLFGDKIVRMGIGIFVGAWMARYLGPEQFGLWSYAIAFVMIFGNFAGLGLTEIIVRELIKVPEMAKSLLGTSYVLKYVGGVVVVLVGAAVCTLVRPNEPLLKLIVVITSLGVFVQAYEVIEFYFQSQVQSKFAVLARNYSFILTSCVRVYLILNHYPLISFVWTALAEVMLTTVGFIYFYKKHAAKKELKISSWKWDGHLAKNLIRDSWPLLLSALVVVIYTRIDQVMLGQMLGNVAVGEFSAAVRLSEFWYFIPMTVTSSLFPSLVQFRKSDHAAYLRRLQQMFDLLSLISIALALVMSFAAPWVIHFLYGTLYQKAATVLSIHIWAAVFVFLGVSASQWFVAENLQRYSFFRTTVGAVLNVVLNLFFIPRHGAVGAAYATLISQFAASYGANALTKQTLPVFKMQTKGILNALALKPLFLLLK